MTRLKLTKGSEDTLYKQGNATGVFFIKSSEKEITSFEFYRGMNGTLNLITNTAKTCPIATVLNELVESIPEEE